MNTPRITKSKWHPVTTSGYAQMDHSENYQEFNDQKLFFSFLFILYVELTYLQKFTNSYATFNMLFYVKPSTLKPIKLKKQKNHKIHLIKKQILKICKYLHHFLQKQTKTWKSHKMIY